MGEIRVGITGWTEPTLIKDGSFYPKKTMSAEERLRFYTEQFPIVEVDSTYYSPPSERNAVLWLERTPKDFVFNVKAYSMLTGHPTRPDGLYKDIREDLPPEVAEKRSLYPKHLTDDQLEEVWQRFHDALMPLHSAGKLGAVLFQFPHWFGISRKNKDELVRCVERMPDYRIAVEFRNASWMEPRNQEETLGLLEHYNLPFVCVDMPQGLKESIPPVAAVTADDLAMVRFHGRDVKQFTAKNVSAAERFRYDYSKEELEEWVPKVREMSESARETHVLMNNCYRNYAVRSATQLASLLTDE